MGDLLCAGKPSPAPLIEPQSGWNVRPGRRTGGLDLDVLGYTAEANTQMGRIMHQNTDFDFRDSKMIFGGGAPHPHILMFSATAAPPYSCAFGDHRGDNGEWGRCFNRLEQIIKVWKSAFTIVRFKLPQREHAKLNCNPPKSNLH